MKKMTKNKLKSLVKKSIPLELMLVATLGASGCSKPAVYGYVAVTDDPSQEEIQLLPTAGKPAPMRDDK